MNITNNPEKKINKKFRLYDEVIWIVGFGLLFLTFKALMSSKPLDQKLLDILGVLWVWIFMLLKIHLIHIKDVQNIIFQGIFRKIILQPRDIHEYQEWVRGARIVYKGGSIILWPYIEKQGELKSILKALNPQIQLRDLAAEGTKTTFRVVLIMIAMFTYFGWLFWSLLHGITNSLK